MRNATSPNGGPLEREKPTAAFDPSGAARLLQAVLDDVATLSHRLDRVVDEWRGISADRRLVVGKHLPALAAALIDAEHYQAEREGVVQVGVINITVQGSFEPSRHRGFSAMEHGHAHAVAEAIAWLAGEVLREAINQDHDFHDDGAKPSRGFEKGSGQ